MTTPVPGGLRWQQPQVEPGFHELRDGEDHTVATLRFEPRPAVVWQLKDQRRARVDAGTSHWDLWVERPGISGWFGLAALVQFTGRTSGEFHAGAGFISGTLEGPGEPLKWQGGAARSASAWVDTEGRTIVRFNPGSILDRINAHVEVSAAAGDRWPFLAALGLYLRLAMNKIFK